MTDDTPSRLDALRDDPKAVRWARMAAQTYLGRPVSDEWIKGIATGMSAALEAAVDQERRAVVAWLRKGAESGVLDDCAVLARIADRIERKEHRQ